MRRNIELHFGSKRPFSGKIYFYTHWGAEGLEGCLRAALIRGRGRWEDPSCLARIIFSEMIRDEVLQETGYGIAPYPMDPEYPTITVNLIRKTVDGKPFEEFCGI